VVVWLILLPFDGTLVHLVLMRSVRTLAWLAFFTIFSLVSGSDCTLISTGVFFSPFWETPRLVLS
jgi:hypothetical protein